jgi:PHD/YefM family antitoxin component YafN of YafNO toxin-antitoxin module
MKTLKASETRIPPDTFNRVAYQGERVRVDRRDGKSVYLVSEEDHGLLARLEDAYWSEEGERALAEFKRSGEPSIPFSELRKKLGI